MMIEHRIDVHAYTAALAIVGDFPELYSDKDKAVVAFKLFVRVKAGMNVLLRELDLSPSKRPPSIN